MNKGQPEKADLTLFLQELGDLSAVEASELSALFSPRTLSVGERLWHAGEHNHELYFIDAGLVRLCYTLESGKEFNKAFVREGMFLAALSSILQVEPIRFFAQALEPCQLQVCDFSAFREHTLTNAKYSALWLRYLEAHFVRHEKREAELQTMTATQRYEALLCDEPELVKRLPQHQIASYLGITEVSLSRLRKGTKALPN